MQIKQRDENIQYTHPHAALYDQYSKAILGYLRLHTNSLEDAEDLLLEVFVAALEKNNLPMLSPGHQLAWLRKVAQNKLSNSYRRTQRHPQTSLDAIANLFFIEEGPEYIALQREAHQQLRSHIQCLPELQQQALQLRYHYGLSCAEIGVLLQKREDAVRKLLSRTIQFLRQVYSQAEGEKKC
ncbi:RNA polymerase sigma factor [Ktedonospora formicarum]|uniref:DNA-directed RNA polymerase sigma-70 factor n=1 Tax=Ktedonospora formicarum TaxID=2778364 RepID=A0A8J3MRI5_9CHLR|nr:sigma-70 family RNA polymerase sigma factor [Ktedonospora formicarum]GHO46092.1 DNA-directed RNA polymerase sigma-70 factor [Ktedonospora formicarum]